MHALPVHLGAGSDLHGSLRELAVAHQAQGFVLSVVGNLTQAAFQCPGQAEPTVVRGELEIITLQGTFSPEGVHLHLSLSDGSCQVWGGHLEPGTLVQKGADLLLGLLAPSTPAPRKQPLVELVVRHGCPWSSRALRMLRTLAIPHRVIEAEEEGPVPQIYIDGALIGGYDALAELHANGTLDSLRM